MKCLLRASFALAGTILLCGRLDAAGILLTQKWCDVIDAQDGGSSRANAVAVDDAGHVYVTGEDGGNLWIGGLPALEGSNGGCSSHPGYLLWTAPSTPIQGIGYGVGLDPTNSNLYVLASIAPSSACWIADLDPVTGGSTANGGWAPQWAPHTIPGCYIGPYSFSAGNNPPRGTLRVSASGTISIGGWTDSTMTTMKVFQLGSNGLQSGANDAFPLLTAANSHGFQNLALDDGGNPYLVGATSGSRGTGFYAESLMYGWSQPLWDGSFNFLTGYSDDRQEGIAVDQSSNVLVGGQFTDSAGGGFWLYSFPLSYVNGSQPNYTANFSDFYYASFFQNQSPPVTIGAFHAMTLAPAGASFCNGALFTAGNQGWIGRFDSANGNFADSYTDSGADSFEGIAADSLGDVYGVGDGRTGGIFIAMYNTTCPNNDLCGTQCNVNQPPPVANTQTCAAYNYPNPYQRHLGSATLFWQLNQALATTVSIHDLLGKLVRQWTFQPNQAGGSIGPNQINWDGTNSQGRPVRQGEYVGNVSSSGGVCNATFRIGVLP